MKVTFEIPILINEIGKDTIRRERHDMVATLPSGVDVEFSYIEEINGDSVQRVWASGHPTAKLRAALSVLGLDPYDLFAKVHYRRI